MEQGLQQYFASEKDAKEYQGKVILFTFAIYACLAFYALGYIHVGLMAAITTVLVTRWMIAFHELLHLRSADDLDLLTRLSPLPFAPFNIGYREYWTIHGGHHRDAVTEADPDAFHILGGHIKALFGALTLHEQQIVRYVRRHGLDRELFLMGGVRLAIFIGLLLAAPAPFLAWWLVLRLTYIVNDFVFFHLVHYRHGEYGSFPIPLPAVLRYAAIALYGIDVVYTTMHHDLHHQEPRIAAKHLSRVAARLADA